MLELLLFVFFGIILINVYSALMILMAIGVFTLLVGVTVGLAFNKFLDIINPNRL